MEYTEFWLYKDGDPRILIGPFGSWDKDEAEEAAHNFRLLKLPSHGFYITREKPPQVYPPSAVDYIKRNLL